MLLPIGHEETTVKRIPFITVGIIALNVLFAFFVTPIIENQKDKIISLHFKKEKIIWEHMLKTGKAIPHTYYTDSRAFDKAVREGQYLDLDSDAYASWIILDDEYKQRVDTTVYHWLGFIPRKFYRLHTFLTSLFVHAGFFHLLGNMWFLYLVGCNVEDIWGRRNFLVFYVAAGAVAATMQAIFHFGSGVPAIGASGAVAGVMGAFMVRNYKTRIRVFYLFPPFVRPFVGTFFVPAVVFFGFWFLTQVLYAVGSGAGAGEVGYWAHIGGFLAGVGTAFAFRLKGIEEKYIAPKIEEEIETVRMPALMELAFKERSEGHNEKALSLLRELLEQQPENVDAHREIANIYLALGDEENAARAFSRVIEVSLKARQSSVAMHTYYEMLFQKLPLALSPEALFTLAGALYRDGRFDDSLALYQRLIKESPESRVAPGAVMRCAQIFEKTGRYQLAMSAYEHLLATYPESEWKETAKSEMESLSRKMYGNRTPF